jgi:hypothetical protein
MMGAPEQSASVGSFYEGLDPRLLAQIQAANNAYREQCKTHKCNHNLQG